METRATMLSPGLLFALDNACRPIRAAFDRAPMLVGSALRKRTYRDVDVRLILEDDDYARLTVERWSMISIAISAYLAAATGLPVDFQVQQMTAAAEKVGGLPRNPLGVRTIFDISGDAPGPDRPEP
jgi:hypothetical protein